MPDPHEKKPEAEEEVLDSEKESQQTQAENYTSEVPEGNMFLTMLTAVGGAAYGPLKKRADLINAFKHINHPNFEYELLKVRDPVKFQKMQRDFELAKKEVEKQRKRENNKKGKKRDFAQVGGGPIKRFRESISFDAFDHKEQAFKLASSVHTRINAQDVRGKIEATARVYYLSPENKTDLMRGIASWQKKNPGVSIDNYFQQTGQKLQYKEHPSKEKLFKRLKTERENAKQLYADLDKVRMESVKVNKEHIIAAQGQIKELISGPIFTEAELQDRIQATLHPQKPDATTPPAPEIKTPIPTTSSTTPKPTVSATPIHRYSTPTPRPHLRIQALERFNIIQNQINQIQQKISQQIISRITESIKNTVIKSTEKIALKLASKATTKVIGAGIKQFLASALPGIGNAAMAILQLTGLDDLILKQVFKIALFAVAVPVGLLILMIFIAPNISREFGAGLSNAESVVIKNSTNTNEYSWRNFEENYLLTEKSNKGEWVYFENKFLVMFGP